MIKFTLALVAVCSAEPLPRLEARKGHMHVENIPEPVNHPLLPQPILDHQFMQLKSAQEKGHMHIENIPEPVNQPLLPQPILEHQFIQLKSAAGKGHMHVENVPEPINHPLLPQPILDHQFMHLKSAPAKDDSSTAPTVSQNIEITQSQDLQPTKRIISSYDAQIGLITDEIKGIQSKKGLDMDYNSSYCSDVSNVGASWWYNWSWYSTQYCSGKQFIPMVWNESTISQLGNLPSGSEWLLGFNEPNLSSQANMSPAYAASLWPQLEATGRKLVSPAMAMGNGIQWMDEFLQHCKDCRIDAIAIHLYENSLGGVQYWIGQFAKYGKPIWVTEIAAPVGSTSECASFASQVTQFMENDYRVEKYAWFMNRGDFGSLSHCSAFDNNGNITEVGKNYRDAN